MKRVSLADSFLIGVGAFFAAVLAYAVFHHERYWVGAVRIALYYGLPAVLAVGSFSALRLSPVRKAQLALLSVTSLTSLYALELFATYYEQGSTARAVRQLGRPFDARSKLEVVRDLRAGGVDAVPCVYPMDLTKGYLRSGEIAARTPEGQPLLPLGGIGAKRTVLCNESGQYVLYDSDEHGFNNPRGSWAARPLQIAALGDSFIQGHCVAADKIAVSLVRQVYPATLNLAMGGNGPLLELATIREFGPALSPAVVLWFYFENDLMMDLEVERSHPILARYLEDPRFAQGLADRQEEIDRQLGDLVLAHMEHSLSEGRVGPGTRLGDFVKLHHLRTAVGLGLGRGRGDLDLFRHVLGEAQETVAAWGGKLYCVYLPSASRYQGWFRPEANREAVLATFRGLSIPVIDIHEAFTRTSHDPLSFFELGGHFSESGHRVVADEVVATLRSELEREAR